jgi:transposase
VRRTRAARLTPLHHPNRQDHRPTIGQHIAEQAHRTGGAAHFTAPVVQQRIEGDRAWIAPADHLLRELALSSVQLATHHEAHACYRRRSIPGVGTILALVRLDESPARPCFPRLQAVVAYGRLGTGAKHSAGQRAGSTGAKSGHADRQWAFAEAAVLFLRHHSAGPKASARWERNHGRGKAVPG